MTEQTVLHPSPNAPSQPLGGLSTTPVPRPAGRFSPELLGALAVFVLAGALSVLVSRINSPNVTLLFYGVLAAGVPTTYLLITRQAADLRRLFFLTFATACVLAVAGYFKWVAPWVSFPADIWLWSESDFVNDIIKFRTGYPMYTDQANNESFDYLPGSQILTYLLASLVGLGTSIPAYRWIQVGYTIASAVIGTLACRRILKLANLDDRIPGGFLWGVTSCAALFLIAINSLSNGFVHLLHNDSLTQLIAVTCFYLLLRYIENRSAVVLTLLCLLPVFGFYVKQSVVIWAAFISGFLLVFDAPRSFKRFFVYTAAWTSLLASTIYACWKMWGPPFFYWTFSVLRAHPVSLRRGLDHAIDVWPFLVIGLIGGIVMLRTSSKSVFRCLIAPWLIWFAFMSAEIYTSGIAFMINHIGPGCLIAGIWAVAALAKATPSLSFSKLPDLQNAASLLVALLLCLAGMKVFTLQFREFSADAYRYKAAIEKEFEGMAPEKVLLDQGSWIYFKNNLVMKDRSPCIGERGPEAIGDFSAIISRIQNHTYDKILVRNLHAIDFWYDFGEWLKPSGIRQALLDNYEEVRVIPAIRLQPSNHFVVNTYTVAPISVLVPRKGKQ